MLTFVAALSRRVALPVQVANEYRRCVSKLEDMSMPIADLQDCLVHSQDLLTQGLHEEAYRDIIDHVLDRLSEGSRLPTHHAIKLTTIVEHLAHAAPESTKLRCALFTSLTVQPTSDKLRNALRTKATSVDEQGPHVSGRCNVTAEGLQAKLVTATCTLFLRAALAAEADEMRIPTDVVSTLLTRHAAQETHTHCPQTLSLIHISEPTRPY